MRVHFVLIGDELLNGQKSDQNSTFTENILAQYMVEFGQKIVVSDDEQKIIAALDFARTDADFVVISGGLGPTPDDKTRHALATFFGATRRFLHSETAERIRKNAQTKGYPLRQTDLVQAEIFDCATIVFPNRLGSACSMGFEKEGTFFVSLPGVPSEFQCIFQEEVFPYIQKRYGLPKRSSGHVLLWGMTESTLAEKLSDFERHCEPDFRLAYLPDGGFVRLVLSVHSVEAQRQFSHRYEELLSIVQGHIVLDGAQTPLDVVREYLLDNRKTIACAESCTSGGLSEQLTLLPGSSAYFVGGIIAYHHHVKQHLLGVDGPGGNDMVSETVVRQMHAGVLRQIAADFALATTGYFSRDRAAEHPLHAFVAVGSAQKIWVNKIDFHTNDRAGNRRKMYSFTWALLQAFLRGQDGICR